MASLGKRFQVVPIHTGEDFSTLVLKHAIQVAENLNMKEGLNDGYVIN